MFPKEAEIVVIGGGIVGSAIAYFLARAGKDVILVNKGCQAGEASAANAAFVSSDASGQLSSFAFFCASAIANARHVGMLHFLQLTLFLSHKSTFV